MKKRVLSLLLCVSLVAGLFLPGVAYADESAGDPTAIETTDPVVCTCEAPEGEAHAEDCALYEAPVEPTEPEVPAECTCEAPEGEAHAEDCPLYEAPVEPTDPEVPAECTCEAAEGEAHAEDCPLYEVPELAFDVDAAYAYLMACTTTAEMEAYAADLTEGDVALFSTDMLDAIDAHYAELFAAEQDINGDAAVNYDHVAKFDQATTTQNSLLPFMTPGLASNAASRSDVDGLETEKSVVQTEDGYELTLTAYTTGEVNVATVKPSDIILVLDLSTSMKETFSSGGYVYSEIYADKLDTSKTYYLTDNGRQSITYCRTCGEWTRGCSGGSQRHKPGTAYTPKSSENASGGTQFYERGYIAGMTRLEAMKQAATAFIDQVADQGSDDRIAIVGFEDDATYMSGDSAASALYDATDQEADLKDIIAGINSDILDYATEHGKGLEYAKNIFEAQSGTSGDASRNKVVVLFTDGAPEPKSSDQWSSRIVQQAINNSYTLKNEYNAAVYSVSVMPGTNASNPTSNMDKYMDYISSNYPAAQYSGTPTTSTSPSTILGQITTGNKIDTTDGSFYLTAGDIETLTAIFEQIAEQTGGAKISLGSETVIRDIISDYFTLPAGANVSDIKVSTEDADYSSGTLGWTTSTISDFAPTISVQDGVIDVSGFDFNANYVAENGRVEGDVTQVGTFHGRRIVIKIPIECKDGFWGGNNVPTNGAGSGVYPDDKPDTDPIEEFVSPEVNVPVDIKKTEHTTNIYYGNGLPDNTVLIGFDKNDPMCAFVEITETSGNTITEEAGGMAEFSVTVAPKDTAKPGSSGASAVETIGKITAHVNVYKPVVTFQDSLINLGNTADYDKDNYVDVNWKHGLLSADSAVMHGDVPKLVYTYNPTAGVFTSETLVSVTRVTTGDKVIYDSVNANTQHVTFEWTKDNSVCTCTVGPEGAHFRVHVPSFHLSITKVVDGAVEQDFIFDVVNTSTNDTYTVVISPGDFAGGKATVVIENLPSGTYTVTERTNWSWKYTLKQVTGTGGVTVDALVATVTGGAEVTFTNVKTSNWMGGSFSKDNVFKKEEAKTRATQDALPVGKEEEEEG